MQAYTRPFYEYLQRNSQSSANVIVPLVLELIRAKEVIDFGCGTGEWLSVFKKYGVEDIWGVDGSWVDRKLLQIPEERFIPFDVRKPFQMVRQFDLVVSLEVAEHLPQESAATFVDSLTKLGPIILFSAAIPGQGGVHHINEQWPEYWAEHFQHKGYVAIDCLRRKIWEHSAVKYFYSQNMFIYARKECLQNYPFLKQEYENNPSKPLSIVHPELYLRKARKANQLELLKSPFSALQFLSNVLKRRAAHPPK
jgi:SAM-dependent methyltransferase